jgi:hypothetical protein
MLQCSDAEIDRYITERVLETCMLSAILEVLPDIKAGLDVDPTKKRWGKLGGMFKELQET